jgi:hypothetical protein
MSAWSPNDVAGAGTSDHARFAGLVLAGQVTDDFLERRLGPVHESATFRPCGLFPDGRQSSRYNRARGS